MTIGARDHRPRTDAQVDTHDRPRLCWIMDEQLEFVRLIAERLQSAGLDYMMTGSMAMAVYTTPRMTRDVDVVVECADRDVDTLVELFAPDCYIDGTAVPEAISSRGMFSIIHSEWIIKGDFIVRKDDPYHRTGFARRREIDVSGTTLSVVAPEDLILAKLKWAQQSGSELQRRDVNEMLGATATLDREYLNDWAERLEVRDLLEEIEG